MADVFLSYAREDLSRIEPLVAALQAAGLDVWYDQTLRAGADFGAETAVALEAAKAVIVVWSPNSIASKWVRDEASVGRDAGKLIPMSIDGALPPLGFRQVQTIDFGAWRGDSAAPPMGRLIAALREPVSAAPLATATPPPQSTARRTARWIALAAALAILIAVARFLLVDGTPDAVERVATDSVAAAPPAGAAPAAIEKSVAVLPFVALSSGDDDGYFADGLTEELINALTTLPDLLVTARTSAFHFKGKDTPIPEIADTLGVAHVVEGSVRRSGDKVRITAQLIRASDGFHLWSETYDRAADDVFAAQTDIAQKVAGALGVLLNEQERARMAEIGVRDVAAFVAFQRGHEMFAAAHGDAPVMATLDRARRHYDEAISRHPGFHEAYAERADFFAHFLMGDGGEFDPGMTEREALRRLGDDLAAASRTAASQSLRRRALLMRAFYSSDWSGLRSLIEEALAGPQPCGGVAGAHMVAMVLGYVDEALRSSLSRTKCDPLSQSTWGDAVMSSLLLGDAAEALRIAESAERAMGRRATTVLSAEADAYLALGRHDEAEATIAELASEAGVHLRARLSAAQGRRDDWTNIRAEIGADPLRLLVAAAVFGDRAQANRQAATLDSWPLGPSVLVRATFICMCGAPFDLSAAPNFARRLGEGDLSWPPKSPIDWPLKDW